ncbi:MAG: cupin domain-containing protein [Chitinophagaceae bacterium]
MSRPSAIHWINRYNMATHVEGGSFVEIYRSPLILPQSSIPAFNGPRRASTHIYFLLQQGQHSSFHRILSDELWHFYEGDPLNIYEIDPSGQLTVHHLGRQTGNEFFTVIQAGSWFAAEPEGQGEYSLVGCTVAPGFDFNDFELARKASLISMYGEHRELINRLAND